MKPVVFYVDDEPHNLTVFEASLPDDWQIFTYDNPLKALEEIEEKKPWLIVSDQRMPGISGVKFLELAMKVCPDAVRIIVTGYSDENLVVDSVRTAKVFDYIRKPWDPAELERSINKAIDYYKATVESKRLLNELLEREKKLQEQTKELSELAKKLEESNKKETELRRELECWVPPFVLMSLKDSKIKFPIRKDIVGITFDIVNSGQIHDKHVNGKPLRALIIQSFSEVILKYGGWRESHSGDSAYGHFGLFEDNQNPCDAALAVAREFRVLLRSLSSVHGVSVECGIALHISKDSLVDVHQVEIKTANGVLVQKSFDTTSKDIDLLHKIEKLTHKLPGSNIIMTGDFYKKLNDKSSNIRGVGSVSVPSIGELELHIIASDLVKEADLEILKTNKKVA